MGRLFVACDFVSITSCAHKKREPAGSRFILLVIPQESTAPRLRQTTINTVRIPSNGATHFSQRT